MSTEERIASVKAKVEALVNTGIHPNELILSPTEFMDLNAQDFAALVKAMPELEPSTLGRSFRANGRLCGVNVFATSEWGSRIEKTPSMTAVMAELEAIANEPSNTSAA